MFRTLGFVLVNNGSLFKFCEFTVGSVLSQFNGLLMLRTGLLEWIGRCYFLLLRLVR